MEDGQKWLFKNKEHGMMSATASIGLVLLWDVDGGLTQIDKYLYSPEDYIKAGALLACGIVNTGVKNGKKLCKYCDDFSMQLVLLLFQKMS
jgi:26S proteasome regulatory subunit N1